MQQGVINGATNHQHNLSMYHIQAKVVISILCYTIDQGMLSIKLMMRANDEAYNWKLYPFMWNTFTRVFQVLNDRFQKA
jgi:hypothetical protein